MRASERHQFPDAGLHRASRPRGRWPEPQNTVMELLRAAIARSLRPEDPAAASSVTVDELAWRVREVCRVTDRRLLPLDREVLTFAQLWLTTLPELKELC